MSFDAPIALGEHHDGSVDTIVVQSVYGDYVVRVPTRPMTKRRNGLIAQAHTELVSHRKVQPIRPGRAQPGDRCLACNKTITPGAPMWTGYNPATRSKTKYHPEHRPTT